MNKPNNIITPQRRMGLRETQRMYKATLESLQNMSIRAQMLGCELQRVDPKNDIFKMTEGVLDKKHVFYLRQALKDGQYEKNRNICRIK